MTDVPHSMRTVIERFGLRRADYDYPDRPYGDLYSGSGVSPAISYSWQGVERVANSLPANAETIDRWGDEPYRRVWRIPDARAHVTYVEGDVSVLIARDDEAFAAIDASANAFYSRH